MINFIGVSQLYSGITNTINFKSIPITVTPNDTLICFIMSYSTGVTAVASPEWNLQFQISGSSSTIKHGTLFCFSLQQTGTTINPTYYITGLGGNGFSDSLHSGYILKFSGCFKDSINNSINAKVGRYNVGGTGIGGTGGITTTRKNSMIVTAVGTTFNYVINGWNSDLSPTPIERAQSGITSGFLSSRLAIATSYKAIEQKKYTIGYSTDTSDDNIAIDITLTPGNTNKLLNIIESFNDS